MKKVLLLTLFALFAFASTIIAQTEAEKKTAAAKESADKAELGWKKGGGLGLDLSGLSLINPRIGAGTNRLGFGGLVNLFATKKAAKSFWENTGALQLGAQRIGGKSQPYQKSVDILRLGSRYAYDISKGKIFAALDVTAETQIMPTYSDNLLEGVDSNLLSKFLSPVRIAVSPGIVYKHDDHLSFFVSPIALNIIYVADELLIPSGRLGNVPGEHSRNQVGFNLKAAYTNKFFKDRIAFGSKLAWFADYTENLNGNVLWQNSADLMIFKGLALSLFGDVFYDHFSQAIVKEVPANTSPDALGPFLGLAPSYTGGFLLKYSRIF